MLMNNDLLNPLIEIASKEILKQEQGNFKQLQNNALFFLKQIGVIQQKIQKSSLQEQAQIFIQAKMNKQSDISDIMFYLSTFQSQINIFLNRTQLLTYVCRDGNLKLFDDFQTWRIYSEMQPDKGGRGKARANDQLARYNETFHTELKNKINQSASNKKRVFSQALRRFEKKDMQYKKRNKNLKKTFYYRLFDYYHITDWSVVTNKGQIAQAYAGAVIEEDDSISNEIMEWSLYNLNNRLENQNRANSIGAILQGDLFIKDQTGQINFAVKSTNIFGSPRIRQFIAFAYNILLFQNLTLEEVKNNLKNFSNIQKNAFTILKDVTDYGQEEIEEIINNVNKMIGV